MKFKRTITTLCLIAFAMVDFVAQGQDTGFLYGKVTTIDDKEYTGAIRWGKEEVFWTDMFNASKEENENLRYLSRREKEDLDEKRYKRYGNNNSSNRLVRWVNNNLNSWDDYEHTHQFSCQFGEIDKLEITGRSRVYLTLQNGDRLEVNGEGYNDIGTSVSVIDSEIGEIKLNWSKIDEIDFMDTPSSLSEKFGEPLYGTVQTYGGTFEGYIQWDHDERLSTDKLDGDTYDGDVSIKFGKIKSIVNDGNRADIVLNSGREMTLRGSNDVNSENRGIIITSPKYGRIDVPWREFRKVEFKSGGSPVPRSSFKSNKELNGTVKTADGNSLTGKIIYDLDEEMDLEVLEGSDDDIKYIIPFSLIKSITPKNYDYSKVMLKNGTELTLGESQDVSDLNSGVLVFEGSGDPTFITWENIDSISFK